MGRKRKYLTVEDQKAANKAKALRYYWAHKEQCDKRAREHYWQKKIEFAEEINALREKYNKKITEVAPITTHEQQ